MDALNYLVIKAIEENNQIGLALTRLTTEGPFNLHRQGDWTNPQLNIEKVLHEIGDLVGLLDMIRTCMMNGESDQTKKSVEDIFEKFLDDSVCMDKQRRVINEVQTLFEAGIITEEVYQKLRACVSEKGTLLPEK